MPFTFKRGCKHTSINSILDNLPATSYENLALHNLGQEKKNTIFEILIHNTLHKVQNIEMEEAIELSQNLITTKVSETIQNHTFR